MSELPESADLVIAESPPAQLRGRTLPGRAQRLSWWISCGLHLAVLGGLLVWEWERLFSSGGIPVSGTVQTRLPDEPAGPLNSGPAWRLPAAGSIAVAPPTASPAFISQQFQQALAAAADIPPEEALSKLTQAGERLQSISNRENVSQLAEWILPALSAAPRRRPASAEGTFDHTTAQIVDVREVRDPNGQVSYLLVLSDAQGRTMEDLSKDPQSAELHRLFRLMDRFPLLKDVYQSIALSIMDRMLAEARTAETR